MKNKERDIKTGREIKEKGREMKRKGGTDRKVNFIWLLELKDKEREREKDNGER